MNKIKYKNFIIKKYIMYIGVEKRRKENYHKFDLCLHTHDYRGAKRNFQDI